MRKAQLLALALVAGVLAPATSAFALGRTTVGRHTATNGSLGIQLLDAPTSRANDPRAKLYIVDHLAPGASIHRRISLTNTSAKAVSAQTYAAAAGISGGAFTGAEGHTPNDLSTWTKVSPATATLPAKGKVIGAVDVTVPKDAAPGERYAIAWVETRSPGSQGGVSEVNRVGIRIYLSVGAGNEPASNFTVDTLTASRGTDGKPIVTAQVHNTGGRALDMSGSLRLSNGPGSLTAGPFPAKLGTTLGVGQTEPVSVFLDEALPNGPWLARLDLQSGLLKRSSTATITFPDKGQAAPVKADLVESEQDGPPWPLIAAGAGGALAIGLILFFFVKRRSRPVGSGQHTDVAHH